MLTLNDMAEKFPTIKNTLNNLEFGNTEAASSINYLCKNFLEDYDVAFQRFTTSETSVRRWRRTKVAGLALDGSESDAEAQTEVALGKSEGSDPDMAEAISEPRLPKVLLIDIETSPNLVHVWQMWQVDVNSDHIVSPVRMLCFSAKWLGDEEVLFYSEFHDGKARMLDALWQLLDEADIVMHYNGKKFDIPHINREFLMRGYTPPSPYKQIDLLHTIRRQFNFPSNKLSYVSKALGTSGKLNSVGYDTWKACMVDDPVAWQKMKKYNIQDTAVLEEIYMKIRPWIQNHPSFSAISGKSLPNCPYCGEDRLKPDGFYYTSVSTYIRYNCTNCGAYSRGTTKTAGTNVAGVSP